MLPLFRSWSIVYEGICPVSRLHLVEYDNIHASHLDGPGRCRHPKFEVVLYRGVDVFSRHQTPQILTRIIHGVALYAGIYGTS